MVLLLFMYITRVKSSHVNKQTNKLILCSEVNADEISHVLLCIELPNATFIASTFEYSILCQILF